MMTVLEHVWPELRCAATPRAFVGYWFAHDAAATETDEKALTASTPITNKEPRIVATVVHPLLLVPSL